MRIGIASGGAACPRHERHHFEFVNSGGRDILKAQSSMEEDPARMEYPEASEWTVSRCHHDIRHVTVHFDGALSSVAWISRLRSLCPELQQRSPSDLLAEVRRAAFVDFGMMSGREAHRLVQLLSVQHFDVRSEDASFVSHCAMVAGSMLLVENDAEAEAFCLRLIREGAAIQEIEA